MEGDFIPFLLSIISDVLVYSGNLRGQGNVAAMYYYYICYDLKDLTRIVWHVFYYECVCSAFQCSANAMQLFP